MKRLYWAVLVFFLLVVIANGWMIDDAYITFRTVDNFLNGHGLRWNVDERVQAYTHPLWMLLMSAASLLTGELYFTSLAVSFACSLAAVWIAAGTVSREAPWKAPLLLLALLCSKAVIDYTSSGLETPLAYLIAAVFLKFMLEDRADQTKLTVAALCASLTFITRPDSVVLYLPAIIYLTWRTGRVRPLLAASLPAAAWMLFSLIYYGFPFPNTAYAKQLGTSFPSSWIVWRGLEYAGNSLLWETAAYALLVLATVLAARQRTARLVIAGVLSYIALVVLRLGSTTHMSGRHFAIPMFVGIVTCVHLLNQKRLAIGTAALLSVFFVWNPVSPVKFGTRAYVPHAQYWSYLDTKFFAFKEGTALLNWRPGRRLPDHQWYHYGEAMKASPKRVFVGVYNGEPIGFAATRPVPTSSSSTSSR